MNKVTVVGSGIVGLTTAICLQEKGFQVRIVAREPHLNTLSVKVGAIWFPFEVHPAEKAHRWASLAYQRYLMERDHDCGVSFIPFISAYTAESDNSWINQLPAGTVRELKPEELPKAIHFAHEAIVPLAEPHKYLPYLFHRFIENGGSFEEKAIENLQELAQLNELVINCTGLGAKALCQDDDLHPMRGQILRCEKLNVPAIVNSTKRGSLSYCIVRSDDCIIGGTDYENDWNSTINPSDTQMILDRFNTFGFDQQTPVIIEEIVGLRPRRSAVRFEFDTHYTNVFHNYGHGGAGFTVAWGCAEELSEIVSKS
ncbi:FAD-dependent oxidoreductase [Marinoscillum pacificum]|uniref:FAD-dependent oxidoreductase n=1 Tax=Marinoscillum pacificum TaxID=392723 RepID=UPI00215823E5|nr:FAD-dependent oxidoreductase [Marinoscillum pacificum]